MKKAEFFVFLLIILLLFSGCTSPRLDNKPYSDRQALFIADSEASFFDDYEDDTKDPLIGYNKIMHSANDILLLKVIKPVHKGYSVLVPKTMRTGLKNFSNHIKSPLRLVNTILQLDFIASGIEISYFFINTCTSLGFADFASEVDTGEYYKKSAYNFSTTLAFWGFKEGPYVVMPFFGPKTLRSAIGTGLDIAVNPLSYIIPSANVYTATSATLQFNKMDNTYIPYEQFKKMSLDPYSGIRDVSLTIERNNILKHRKREE